jgi:release factor glutamine methyltransferase
VNIRNALRQGEAALTPLPHADPTLEATLLLCEALECPRTYLMAWPERELEPAQSAAFRALVDRRRQGEPIAHILGRREFWSLSLEVTRNTLIPRPDTELLVERALERVPTDAAWCIADLGTGTGAIAAALAVERPECRIIATDRSIAALKVAERNLWRLGITQIELRRGCWWEPFEPDVRFDLVLSNPPYVAEGDPHLCQGDLPYEPRGALIAGPDGMDDLRRITQGVRAHLRPGGWLLLEHGMEQGPAVRASLGEQGLAQIRTYRDLAGHERVTEGLFPR